MPAVTRWFIKASLVYLVLSLALTLLLSWQVTTLSAIPGLSAVFFHFFMVGWVTQMIIGVAYWFFPKFSAAQPRRSERMAWWIFGLLNAGLLLRGLGEPLFALQPDSGWRLALVASAALQWLAGALFVVNSWARVKER